MIVAFHFYLYSDQAGWKCDSCRSSGLDMRRRCGWRNDVDVAESRIVWGRKQVSSNTCPKSFITGQSIAWLEEFVVRKRLRQNWPEELSARDAEAFVILEAEWDAETRHA